MKKLMYIFLILPLIMSGCKGKKETERGGMPTPEISGISTRTKHYPNKRLSGISDYRTNSKSGSQSQRCLAVRLFHTGNSCEAGATLIRNRTNDLQR